MRFYPFVLPGSLIAMLTLPVTAISGGAGEGRVFRARLVDGSAYQVTVPTPSLEVETRYGKVTVPMAEVRHVFLGLRNSAEIQANVRVAVQQLGNRDDKVRDAARNELRNLREAAYPALWEGKNHPDSEVKSLAEALARSLEDAAGPPLRIREDDVILTQSHPVVGRITAKSLVVRAIPFGEKDLQLSDALELWSEAERSGLDAGIFQLREQAFHQLRAPAVPPSGVFQARLGDGSLIKVTFPADHLSIDVENVLRKVPAAQIQSVRFGFRYPKDLEQQVSQAIERLNDQSFRVRNAAEADLLKLKQFAYPRLVQAKSHESVEVQRRAADLIRKIEETVSPELLRSNAGDVIVTSKETLMGRMPGNTVEIHSSVFGTGKVDLTDLIDLYSFGSELQLIDQARAFAQAGRIRRGTMMGTGKDEYTELPALGGLLTGFEVTYGDFGGNATVTTVRPIFRTAAGRKLGVVHGNPGKGVYRVEAKTGYAVGAVTIQAGLGVDGMSVTFMKVSGTKLDPKDSYESEWLGGPGGGKRMKLAGNGTPVIGIFGRTAEGNSTFNGLGLITLGETEPGDQELPRQAGRENDRKE